MDITDNNNENERNEENLFDGDFIKFLENQNNKISASVKIPCLGSIMNSLFWWTFL